VVGALSSTEDASMKAFVAALSFLFVYLQHGQLLDFNLFLSRFRVPSFEHSLDMPELIERVRSSGRHKLFQHSTLPGVKSLVMHLAFFPLVLGCSLWL